LIEGKEARKPAHGGSGVIKQRMKSIELATVVECSELDLSRDEYADDPTCDKLNVQRRLNVAVALNC
jgi:hypothetical protein